MCCIKIILIFLVFKILVIDAYYHFYSKGGQSRSDGNSRYNIMNVPVNNELKYAQDQRLSNDLYYAPIDGYSPSIDPYAAPAISYIESHDLNSPSNTGFWSSSKNDDYSIDVDNLRGFTDDNYDASLPMYSNQYRGKYVDSSKYFESYSSGYGQASKHPEAYTSGYGQASKHSGTYTSGYGQASKHPEAYTSGNGQASKHSGTYTSGYGQASKHPEAYTSGYGQASKHPEAYTSGYGQDSKHPQAYTNGYGQASKHPQAYTSGYGQDSNHPKAYKSGYSLVSEKPKSHTNEYGNAGISYSGKKQLHDRSYASDFFDDTKYYGGQVREYERPVERYMNSENLPYATTNFDVTKERNYPDSFNDLNTKKTIESVTEKPKKLSKAERFEAAKTAPIKSIKSSKHLNILRERKDHTLNAINIFH